MTSRRKLNIVFLVLFLVLLAGGAVAGLRLWLDRREAAELSTQIRQGFDRDEREIGRAHV